jgi:HD-like signal output (HDOD) protein
MDEQLSVAQRLSTCSLPPNAGSTTALLRLLMDSDKDMADVASAIQSHAVIVGKLISLANSAWSNPVRPVTALDEACSRLGLDVVRTLSIALAVGRSFIVSRCPEFDPRQYWISSIVAADIASRLALSLKLDPSTARAAGLLHNIGLLWLADCAPEETDAALKAARTLSDFGVDEHLQQKCGIGYRDAGAVLMSRWTLPDALISSFKLNQRIDGQSEARQMYELIQTSADLTANVLTGNTEPFDDCCLDELTATRLNSEIAHQVSRLPKTEVLAARLVGS